MRKILVLSLLFLTSVSYADVRYETFTDIQSLIARDVLESYSKESEVSEEPNVPYVYRPAEIDNMIKNGTLVYNIRDIDKCQFAPDIENYARKVHHPVFQFLFGYMLINNICFKRDQELGYKYIEQSSTNLYTEALVFKAKNTLDNREKFRNLYIAFLLDDVNGLLEFCREISLNNKEFMRPELYLEIQDKLLEKSSSNEINLKKEYYLKVIQQLIPPNLRKDTK